MINDGILCQVNIPPQAVTLGDAIDELFKRRRGFRETLGPNFAVEKKSEPGIALDLDARLTSLNTREFRVVPDSPSPPTSSVAHRSDRLFGQKCPEMRLFHSGSFQTYVVQMIQKLGKNATVQLGSY